MLVRRPSTAVEWILQNQGADAPPGQRQAENRPSPTESLISGRGQVKADRGLARGSLRKDELDIAGAALVGESRSLKGTLERTSPNNDGIPSFCGVVPPDLHRLRFRTGIAVTVNFFQKVQIAPSLPEKEPSVGLSGIEPIEKAGRHEIHSGCTRRDHGNDRLEIAELCFFVNV